MNLFLKIFLWFLAAIALMIGVVLFLNWSVQTEPVVSRWRISVRNQTNIYAQTAGQIYENEGVNALAQFLDRIRTSETVGEVDIIGENGWVWPPGLASAENYKDLVAKALSEDAVQIELHPETA